MAISDKIKEHRKKLGITQRELAETLGVSVQAISKWETGGGIPDVSALVPLAKELHITTDELLDFRDRRKELEKLWHKTLMNYGEGSKELYDCTCEALKEFPKDETFLYRRAVEARFLYENTDKSDPDRNTWFRKHHAQLLSVMGLYPEWDWPIAEMVYLLVAADRKHDAIIYAKRAAKEKQDMLLKRCLEGEELRHLRQVRVEKMFRDLLNELRCEDTVFLDIEEQLIQTVIPDGNYLYYFDLLMMIEMKRAEISVTEKEYDQALSHLEKAFAYARKEDASPSGKFTCHLFDTIPFRNYKETDHPSLAEQFRFILTNNKLLSVLEHRNAYQRLIRQADACIQYGEKGLFPTKDTDETTFPLSEFLDLMEIAKTDMEASEQLAMSEVLVMETVNGSIYRTLVTDPLPYATNAVSEMVQTMKAQGNIEIKRLVCYRQDGFFVMPKPAVLRILCALHRNNAEAPLLLSGNSGLLKRKIKETFPSYLQKFLYCKPDAVDLFEAEKVIPESVQLYLYENNPCSSCRSRVFLSLMARYRDMTGLHEPLASIRKEAQLDCDYGTRMQAKAQTITREVQPSPTKNNFEFFAVDLHFLGNTEKERAQDCCLHGKATLRINGQNFADGIECCLTASALRFLRTLHRDHKTGEEEFLFPCCGNMLIPAEDGRTVTVIGCPNGTEFPIYHVGNHVVLGLGKDEQRVVAYEEYREAVKSYAEAILTFIKNSPPRHFANEHDRKGFEAFLTEYQDLLSK